MLHGVVSAAGSPTARIIDQALIHCSGARSPREPDATSLEVAESPNRRGRCSRRDLVPHRWLLPPRCPAHESCRNAHRSPLYLFITVPGTATSSTRRLRSQPPLMASWSIAFFEYWLAVPPHPIAHPLYSAAELQTMQEVITLLVFAAFLVLFLKEPLGWITPLASPSSQRARSSSSRTLRNASAPPLGRRRFRPAVAHAGGDERNRRTTGARRGCARRGPPSRRSSSHDLLAVELEAHQQLPGSAPTNRLPRHAGNRSAGVERHARRRDRRIPVVAPAAPCRPSRALADLGARIVAVGDDRPAVVLAGPRDVDLVAAARAVLDASTARRSAGLSAAPARCDGRATRSRARPRVRRTDCPGTQPSGLMRTILPRCLPRFCALWRC